MIHTVATYYELLAISSLVISRVIVAMHIVKYWFFGDERVCHMKEIHSV